MLVANANKIGDEMDRWFPVTVMFGRVYLDGDASYDEDIVDLLVSRVNHRKARTVEELADLVRESERGLPSMRTWIFEELRKSTLLSQ